MWIFIWVIVSLFILGIFVWSVVILREQKSAWAVFAKKHAMAYTKGKFMEAAIVRGTIGGFRMSLFSDTQQTQDVRGQRYVSVMEFELGAGMPTGAAVGTKEMKAFIDTLSFNETVMPGSEKWSPEFIAKARDAALFKAYLTPARIDALIDIFSMKRVTVLFFFDEQDCVLHIETVDPLRNAEKLDRIVARIVAQVQKLALTDAERQQWAHIVPPAPPPFVAPALTSQPEIPTAPLLPLKNDPF